MPQDWSICAKLLCQTRVSMLIPSSLLYLLYNYWHTHLLHASAHTQAEMLRCNMGQLSVLSRGGCAAGWPIGGQGWWDVTVPKVMFMSIWGFISVNFVMLSKSCSRCKHMRKETNCCTTLLLQSERRWGIMSSVYLLLRGFQNSSEKMLFKVIILNAICYSKGLIRNFNFEVMVSLMG